MKKGRPAHTLSVLADPILADDLIAVITGETGTLGVRGHAVDRWPLPRHTERVDVDDRSVRVKVGPGRAKAEFDDAARVARLTGRPAREVAAEAEHAWLHVHDGGAGHDHGHDHDHPHPHSHDHGEDLDDEPA